MRKTAGDVGSAICTITVHMLRAALQHVSSRNIFQIGMVCRSENCAFLKLFRMLLSFIMKCQYRLAAIDGVYENALTGNCTPNRN